MFDFCIGNPPYTYKNKVGNVYGKYVLYGRSISEYAEFVHPSNWLVNDKELLSSGLRWFDLISDVKTIFPSVDGKWGLTITKYAPGDGIHYSIDGAGDYAFCFDQQFFFTMEHKKVYDHVIDKLGDFSSIRPRVLGQIGSLGACDFGYTKGKHSEFLCDTADGLKHPVKVWASKEEGRGCRYRWHYIDECHLKETDILNKRKVMLSKIGNFKTVIGNDIQLVEPRATGGNVLFVLPEHDTDYELQLIQSYFMTRTVRFLITITKLGQYVKGFENVPDYTYFIDALNGQLFTDEFLYDYLDFDKELIDYIEARVSAKGGDV